MAKKTLILAFGPGKPPMGKDDDRDEEKAQAGKAFAAAIKGGDGLEIAEAYEALKEACAGSSMGKGERHPYAESESDDGEEEEAGFEE